jgi:hypothetical protein
MKYYTLNTLILLFFLIHTSGHRLSAADRQHNTAPAELTGISGSDTQTTPDNMTELNIRNLSEEFILICMPPITFSSVRAYNVVENTFELHDATTIQQDAEMLADIWIQQNYLGLSKGEDYEFGEYSPPVICGDGGSMIIVFVSETGNQYCVLEIIWTDQIKELTCPDDLTLTEGPSNLTETEAWLATVTAEGYISSSHFSVTNNFNAATMLSPGEHTITFTARNCMQNVVGNCQRTLTIEAAQPDLPHAVCQNITLELDANGLANLSPAMIDGGSSNGTLSVDITQFTCADLGNNQVTLTVTNSTNLTATCMATVTVVDNSLPDFGRGNKSIRAVITEGEEYILEELSLQFPATDNCGGTLTYTQTPPAGTVYTAATTETITLGVEDNSGNYEEIPVKFTLQVRKNNQNKGGPGGGGGGRPLSVGTAENNNEISLKSASLGGPDSEPGSSILKSWPNPFTDRLYFEIIAVENSHALLEIYAITGQKVVTLIDRPVEKDQIYRLEFSPADNPGTIYFYRLQMGNYTDSGKILRKP